MAEKRKLRPFALHMTFIYGGQLAKRHRYREEKLWYDNSTYYNIDSTEGYITFDFQIPPELLNNSIPRNPGIGFKNFQGHFNLIHH